jgi:hypothetical protein
MKHGRVLTPKFERAFRKFVRRDAGLQKRIARTLAHAYVGTNDCAT